MKKITNRNFHQLKIGSLLLLKEYNNNKRFAIITGMGDGERYINIVFQNIKYGNYYSKDDLTYSGEYKWYML